MEACEKLVYVRSGTEKPSVEDVKREVVRAKKVGQHRAGRTAQRTVAGYVAGVVWRRNERRSNSGPLPCPDCRR